MPTTKSEIERLAGEGFTRRQIACQLGCHYSYVQQVVKEYHIPIRNVVRPPTDRNRIAELVSAGYSLSEMVALTGYSRSSVHRAVMWNGGYQYRVKRIPPQIRKRIYNMARHGVCYKYIAEIFDLQRWQVTACVHRHFGGKVFGSEGIRKGKPPTEERIRIMVKVATRRMNAKYPGYPELVVNAVASAAVAIQEYPDGEGVVSLFWRIASMRMVDEIRGEKGDTRRTIQGPRKIKTEEMKGDIWEERIPEYNPDEIAILRAKIGALLERIRIFGYTYLETGCNRRETARRLGLSESSVDRNLHELKEALRESYGLVTSSEES